MVVEKGIIMTLEIAFKFLIGSITRMLVVFFWLPKLKEIKKTGKIDNPKTLKNIFLHEAGPVLHEEMHEIITIKKYLIAK